MRTGERPELAALFEEAVAFYLRLRGAAALIHRRGELSGPRRTVMLGLARTGPQTVATLARARSESRQRFQPLVNALIKEGLLKRMPNPAHRRSVLVGLTERGASAVTRILKKESALRGQLRLDVPPMDLAAATAVLRRVRQALEHPDTIRLLESHSK